MNWTYQDSCLHNKFIYEFEVLSSVPVMESEPWYEKLIQSMLCFVTGKPLGVETAETSAS